MGMNLYYGGYGAYLDFTVAETEERAIENIGKKLNAAFLPITAEKIDSIDGFHIKPEICVESGDKETNVVSQESPEKPTEAKNEPPKMRHCKQCDFECESQGELMKHYREKHPKEA